MIGFQFHASGHYVGAGPDAEYVEKKVKAFLHKKFQSFEKAFTGITTDECFGVRTHACKEPVTPTHDPRIYRERSPSKRGSRKKNAASDSDENGKS